MESNSKDGIFKSIDGAIFQQIKVMRGSSHFEKISEGLRSLTEKEQLIVNQILSALSLLIPVVAIAAILIVRFNLNSDLELRQKIQKQIISIKENSIKLKSLENAVVSRSPINAKRDLVNKINTISSRKKIDKKNIILDNFSDSSLGGTISKIEATAKFKDLTTVNFSNFLLELQKNLKANINNIEVSKNQKDLLVGKINFVMFSKVNQ
ncbi:MAG: hypothetical protein BM556_11150 [Bacteriovorax sp. MedPE-SWde]|nr:MAG: hypothetical protein BM556_11150 [Bacteriovorax sp. MedPE-SWde]